MRGRSGRSSAWIRRRIRLRSTADFDTFVPTTTTKRLIDRPFFRNFMPHTGSKTLLPEAKSVFRSFSCLRRFAPESILFLGGFALNAYALAPSGTAARKHLLARGGPHLAAEPVDLRGAAFFRLIGSFWHTCGSVSHRPQLINHCIRKFHTCPHVDI